MEELVGKADQLVSKYRGKIATTTDPQEFVTMLETYENIFGNAGRLYYPSLLFAADTDNEEAKTLEAKVRSKAVEVTNSLVFVDLEINQIPDDQYEQLLANDELRTRYGHFLDKIRQRKPHQLSEVVEQVINEKDLTGKSAFVNLYHEYTSSFKFPMSDGRELNMSAVRTLMQHTDPAVRREAMEVFYRVFKENKIVTTNVYNNIIKDHALETKRRNYDSPIAFRHLGNQVTAEMVDAMMEVAKSNYHLVGRYYKAKGKALGLETMTGSDLYAPIGNMDKDYSWEDARKVITESYANFDPEFGKLAERFFTDNLVDAEPRPTKRGGAFCAGVQPDLPPVILMSYEDKIDHVATLAHEMGHGIHFFLAGHEQSQVNYSPPLVLAETASILGEMILRDKLVSQLEDEETKKGFLANQIDDVIATIYRQTMYTFFELEAHTEGAKRRLSSDDLCQIWRKQVDECYGSDIQWLADQDWNWSSIPHFQMYPFYCYAYSFANLFVLALYKQYKEKGQEFVPKIIEILAAGGSRYPQEIAESVGIDLASKEFWQGGFDYIAGLIEQFERMVG